MIFPDNQGDTHDPVPLMVDVDGTLLRTDLLVESFLALFSTRPWRALWVLLALRRGKAALKEALADHAPIDVATLPVNGALIEFLRSEKAHGRKIYLASASDRRYVEALAAHVGLFDGVFATSDGVNLSGPTKADALCAAFGEGGFDYAGDAATDLPVWRRAREAILVNAKPSLVARVRRDLRMTRVFERPRRGLGLYMRAIRVHQWLKNLLIFVPALAAHQIDGVIGVGVPTFLSFSLCASSVYLLNDMLDLKDDRRHPSKSQRVFASGAMPLLQGLLLVPGLLALSAAIALWRLPIELLGILTLYWSGTLAYSLWLKRHLLIDVVVLACLYGLRLLAGGAMMDLALSPWLLAFSLFLFFSLALVKRCTELIDRGSDDASRRAYKQGDLPILEAMAAASGYASVVVMAFYLSSPAVIDLYRHPYYLWFVCLILVYWLSRVLLLTHRGEMHDDPVIFAATDRISLASGGLIALTLAISA